MTKWKAQVPSRTPALWTSPRPHSWKWFKIKALTTTPVRMSELTPGAVKLATVNSKETTWANKPQASAKVLSDTRDHRWNMTEMANQFKRWSKVARRSSASADPGSTCRERRWIKFSMTRKTKFPNLSRLPKPDAPPTRRQHPPRNPNINKRSWTTSRATANSRSQQIWASSTSTVRITNTLSRSNSKPECRSPASNSTRPRAKAATFHPCTPKLRKGLRL